MTGSRGEGLASVLLVDDHAVLAVPLTMALESSGFGPVVAADVDDLSEPAILTTAGSLRPDIVLLDLHLGGDRLGLPMIPALVELGGKVVLFTANHDPRLLALGLRSGAEAVLDKAMPFHRLVAALTELAAGRPLMDPEEREALLEALEAHLAEETARRRPFEALTGREAQVLRLLIEGRSPKEIARSEGISVSTVRGHIDRMLAKLDVSSQREALAMARSVGWPEAGAGSPPG
ncbi:MAG TPA: response regulator transcription factor [Acidimicrobiales bacterium]|nr:response regulator transcription factor [Acidimicrobiales bacterium]